MAWSFPSNDPKSPWWLNHTMLIKGATLDQVLAGTVDRAYRRWKRPSVNAGTRLRTSHGLIEITDVRVIEEEDLNADHARLAGYDDVSELVDDLSPVEDGRVLYEIRLRYAGEDPRIALRQDTEIDEGRRRQIVASIDRIGRRGGPTGMDLLQIVADRPGALAADLAEELGVDRQVLKRRVRQLKELGLTESLSRGYQLSPRGEAILRRTS